MKIAIKKIFLRIVFFCNICCILALLVSNAAPYLNPYKWWPVALTGIFFPLLVIITLLFFFFWLPVRPRKAVFSLLAILISIPNIILTFGLAVSSKFTQTKEKGDLRLITWNTGLMNYTAPDSNTAILNNAAIFRKLKEADADIICLQEFFTAVLPGNHLNFIDSIAKTMSYPYHYFSFDISKFEGNFYSGSIIFSRHPIVDTQKIDYPKPFAGSIIKAGVIISGDTIDIITTRLQSVHFQRNEYRELNNIKKGMDSGLTGAKNIIYKLRLGYKRRVEQVKLVKELISKSNRPLIFTGDLNDVPVSYTYSEVRNNLKDAWVKKGTGLGRTFVYISPTLRIDQIFFNAHFSARQVKRVFAEGASDHNALVADLIFKKEQ
jgi:endonuclease/exonuclease/phosphatase family metal-dependent hydrolase